MMSYMLCDVIKGLVLQTFAHLAGAASVHASSGSLSRLATATIGHCVLTLPVFDLTTSGTM